MHIFMHSTCTVDLLRLKVIEYTYDSLIDLDTWLIRVNEQEMLKEFTVMASFDAKKISMICLSCEDLPNRASLFSLLYIERKIYV